MAVNTKAIKRRLRSVGSTKKITKAMEMVAAAKMRKAVNAALDTRTYAKLAWDLLVSLSKTQKSAIPLLQVRTVKKLLIILVTSDRGLCGSFNANIIRKTAKQLEDPSIISRHRVKNQDIPSANKDIAIDIIGIGKKGADFAKKTGNNLIASFTDLSDTPKLNDVYPISRLAIQEYAEKKYDKVIVAYTEFYSAISQIAKMRQVLPISEQDLEKMITDVDNIEAKLPPPETDYSEDFLFEPNRQEVLKIILPRLVETQIYQALLESAASEHSARMLAMRNASEAAEEMINDLNLHYNKARQAIITREIAEIAGGTAALK